MNYDARDQEKGLPPPGVLALKAIGPLLGVNSTTAYSWRSRGKLDGVPFWIIDGEMHYRLEDVQARTGRRLKQPAPPAGHVAEADSQMTGADRHVTKPHGQMTGADRRMTEFSGHEAGADRRVATPDRDITSHASQVTRQVLPRSEGGGSTQYRTSDRHVTARSRHMTGADGRMTDAGGHVTGTDGSRAASVGAAWSPQARARLTELEEESASLRERLLEMGKALLQAEAKLEATQEAQETYGRIFAGEIRQFTDQVAEHNQQTTALQVRASAEVHVARQEAGMLAEQLDDMRNSQAAMSEAQKMLAEQYEARISDLRSSHVREFNAVREGDAAQLNAERAQRAALQENLARAQAEVNRLVAAGARRDQELAQAQAELAAYRTWAAKGGLARMFSRPELPEAPQGLLPGPEIE